jgi:hypothetical protein
MHFLTDHFTNKIWTVAEAKARLSELLRLASDKPQYIGKQKTYVLISREKWEELIQPKVSVGQHLVEAMAGMGELELPSRKDPEREIPFQAASY